MSIVSKLWNGSFLFEGHAHSLCVCVSLQHFVCAKCEKPFLGHRHYERKGLAYCETHYNQVTHAWLFFQSPFWSEKTVLWIMKRFNVRLKHLFCLLCSSLVMFVIIATVWSKEMVIALYLNILTFSSPSLKLQYIIITKNNALMCSGYG